MSNTEYPNLKPDGLGRRTNKDITRYLTPKQVYKLINNDKWPYRRDSTRGFLQDRDLALGSMEYLSCGRVHEVLKLKAQQFTLDEEDKNFYVCNAYQVGKRKKGKRKPIIEIPLPRKGVLKPFTVSVINYVDQLRLEQSLFPFSSSRAWQIVNWITGEPKEDLTSKMDGKWNHWFRAQSLSYQINLLRSSTIVAKDRGIENSSTIDHYYQGAWREHKEELLK